MQLGLLLVPVLAGLLVGCTKAELWTNRTVGTSATAKRWTGVASDATGAHLVAVNAPWSYGGAEGTVSMDGDVWTSSDSGATWINRTMGTAATGQGWARVASDATGAHLVATARSLNGETSVTGDVWTSSDSGATWTKRTTVTSTAEFLLAPSVVSDTTGTRLVLASGDIWTSSDSGVTWIDQTAGTSAAAQSWVAIAADATTTHLVGVTAYSDIWTSQDSGATWTNRTTGTAASGHDWQGVASDATGTHLVAVTNLPGGDIWTSSDSGATWTNRTTGTAASEQAWGWVASDATGAYLVAATFGGGDGIWTSSDSGATWTNQTSGTAASSPMWAGLASDATGTHLVAVSDNPAALSPIVGGDIWTN